MIFPARLVHSVPISVAEKYRDTTHIWLARDNTENHHRRRIILTDRVDRLEEGNGRKERTFRQNKVRLSGVRSAFLRNFHGVVLKKRGALYSTLFLFPGRWGGGG